MWAWSRWRNSRISSCGLSSWNLRIFSMGKTWRIYMRISRIYGEGHGESERKSLNLQSSMGSTNQKQWRGIKEHVFGMARHTPVGPGGNKWTSGSRVMPWWWNTVPLASLQLLWLEGIPRISHEIHNFDRLNMVKSPFFMKHPHVLIL